MVPIGVSFGLMLVGIMSAICRKNGRRDSIRPMIKGRFCSEIAIIECFVTLDLFRDSPDACPVL